MIGVLLFSQCKKDEEDWVFCVDCDLSSWVGVYNGSGVYYTDYDGGSSALDVPVVVTIENSSGTILKTNVTAEDFFTISFIVDKTDNEYIIELPGSSSSLSLTLSKRGNDYKLSGTAKSYHHQGDSLFIYNSISFDVFKSPE